MRCSFTMKLLKRSPRRLLLAQTNVGRRATQVYLSCLPVLATEHVDQHRVVDTRCTTTEQLLQTLRREHDVHSYKRVELKDREQTASMHPLVHATEV